MTSIVGTLRSARKYGTTPTVGYHRQAWQKENYSCMTKYGPMYFGNLHELSKNHAREKKDRWVKFKDEGILFPLMICVMAFIVVGPVIITVWLGASIYLAIPLTALIWMEVAIRAFESENKAKK